MRIKPLIAIITLLLLCASSVPAATTSTTTYSFGLGTFKFASAEIGAVPLDFHFRSGNADFGVTLGYGLDIDSYDTDHLISLFVPLTFPIYENGPFRLRVGGEFQNYLFVSNYVGTHTIGPLFSMETDIPYNGSGNELDFALLFGAAADDYISAFIVDMVIRDDFQLYFNDKTGIHAGVTITTNLTGSYYGFYDRALIYFGPCFRW